MLVEENPSSQNLYESMMADLLRFPRSGFESLYLEYRPLPSGEGQWRRVGLTENEVYDDPFAYALIGLHDYEGWSLTVKKVCNIINTIRASGQYPAYNPPILLGLNSHASEFRSESLNSLI